MHAIRKSSRDLIETDVDDETIIVALETGHLYSVKGSGLAIWRLIDGSRSEEQITAEICKQYGIDQQTAVADVEEFLADVKSVGLID